MSDFTMPSLGADMESGKLVEWKIAPGDKVRKGQVVAAVETAKAVLDVEVFEDGVVEEILVEEGAEVPVGTPLARLRGEGEAARQDEAPAPATETADVADAAAKATPRDREQPVPAETSAAASAPPPPSGPDSPKTSPAARREARKLGIELSGLAGSGPEGAVVLRDVQRAAESSPQPAAGPGFDPARMRHTIAAAMSRSKREIPHFYLADTVDLHAARRWLDAHNEDLPPEERILPAALFVRATARALARHPALNGHYGEDGFTPADNIHLGIAIHLRGGGLIAPALLDADNGTLVELMARLQDLVRRARSGGLRGSEVDQPTATLTNLGERGVDTVYGVIHPPQVAMVGFGRVRSRPMAVDDALAVRPAVNITLAADHRVCDGHLGGRFLNEIHTLLQSPEAL